MENFIPKGYKLSFKFVSNEQKPWKVGVYKTNSYITSYQYWNGEWWGRFSDYPANAARFSNLKSDHQNVEWKEF